MLSKSKRRGRINKNKVQVNILIEVNIKLKQTKIFSQECYHLKIKRFKEKFSNWDTKYRVMN